MGDWRQHSGKAQGFLKKQLAEVDREKFKIIHFLFFDFQFIGAVVVAKTLITKKFSEDHIREQVLKAASKHRACNCVFFIMISETREGCMNNKNWIFIDGDYYGELCSLNSELSVVLEYCCDDVFKIVSRVLGHRFIEGFINASAKGDVTKLTLKPIPIGDIRIIFKS